MDPLFIGLSWVNLLFSLASGSSRLASPRLHRPCWIVTGIFFRRGYLAQAVCVALDKRHGSHIVRAW